LRDRAAAVAVAGSRKAAVAAAEVPRPQKDNRVAQKIAR